MDFVNHGERETMTDDETKMCTWCFAQSKHIGVDGLPICEGCKADGEDVHHQRAMDEWRAKYSIFYTPDQYAQGARSEI
jgi:hypothetical protein